MKADFVFKYLKTLDLLKISHLCLQIPWSTLHKINAKIMQKPKAKVCKFLTQKILWNQIHV